MKALVIKLAVVSSFMLLIAMSGNAFSSPRGGKAGPPPWAPAKGYREEVRHVYFPQYNMYYDLKERTYLLRVGNRWEKTQALPKDLTHAELRNARKVEVTVNTSAPYRYRVFHTPKGRKGNPRR